MAAVETQKEATREQIRDLALKIESCVNDHAPAELEEADIFEALFTAAHLLTGAFNVTAFIHALAGKEPSDG